MAHHGKSGRRAVSLNLDQEQRDELLRLTGERTLTAAVHEALADFVLEEQFRAARRARLEREHRANIRGT